MHACYTFQKIKRTRNVIYNVYNIYIPFGRILLLFKAVTILHNSFSSGKILCTHSGEIVTDLNKRNIRPLVYDTFSPHCRNGSQPFTFLGHFDLALASSAWSRSAEVNIWITFLQWG